MPTYHRERQLSLRNLHDVMLLLLERWKGVTQGHWKCHHSTAWVWFPIQLLQQLYMAVYRTVSEMIHRLIGRDMQKSMFFAFEIFREIFQFFRSFFKYFILPDTAIPCKKIKLCANVNTVNDWESNNDNFIFTYASVKSQKTYCTSSVILNV